MIEETSSTGAMATDYIFFAGRRIAWRDSSGNVYYYFADAIGSTRAATNATGTVCFSADYYPYGQENDYDTSCSPTYKFTGYEYDSETGNAFFASRTDLRDYYAYARYYNPRLGRFMSPDPLAGAVGNPQSLDLYAYVRNSPTSLVDPMGEDCTGAWDSSGQGGISCTDGGVGAPSNGCWRVVVDGMTAGKSCGPGVVEGKGDGAYGGGGGGGGTGGTAGGSTAGAPQSPQCTAAQRYAAQVGQILHQTAEDFGLIAAGGGLATAIFGVGEGPTFGLDTAGTVTAGAVTGIACEASFITGTAASAFNSFANGNLNALRSFDLTRLAGLATTLAASKLPFIGRFAEQIGYAAEQATAAAQEAQAACQ